MVIPQHLPLESTSRRGASLTAVLSRVGLLPFAYALALPPCLSARFYFYGVPAIGQVQW